MFRFGSVVAWALLLVACPGCPPYRDATVPGDIRKVAEPALGGDYWLYVPTTYDPAEQWALIVVCHGTVPFDYAGRQIRDWAKLAEERQFIVAAPLLEGVSIILPPPATRQLALQRKDERTILACVRHLKGGYNIAADRVFLTGWSAGAYAVLHTGLRNPHVFRALAVLQGNFNADYLTEAARGRRSAAPTSTIPSRPTPSSSEWSARFPGCTSGPQPRTPMRL